MLKLPENCQFEFGDDDHHYINNFAFVRHHSAVVQLHPFNLKSSRTRLYNQTSPENCALLRDYQRELQVGQFLILLPPLPDQIYSSVPELEIPGLSNRHHEPVRIRRFPLGLPSNLAGIVYKVALEQCCDAPSMKAIKRLAMFLRRCWKFLSRDVGE